MTRDDILQALKLTAMGRYGHDLQVQLAERLELLFLESGAVAIAAAEQGVAEKLAAAGEPPKRGPARPKKAD